jgi:hypothetical protein
MISMSLNSIERIRLLHEWKFRLAKTLTRPLCGRPLPEDEVNKKIAGCAGLCAYGDIVYILDR